MRTQIRSGRLAAQRLVVEPQVRHDARAEVVDDDVGGEREAARDARRRAGRPGSSTTLRLPRMSVPGEAAAPVAEVERVAALDLDHVGAEIGEECASSRDRRRPR